jgi:hypothetical protein
MALRSEYKFLKLLVLLEGSYLSSSVHADTLKEDALLLQDRIHPSWLYKEPSRALRSNRLLLSNGQ